MMLSVAGWNGLLGRREVRGGLPSLNYPLPGAQRIAVVGTRMRAERRAAAKAKRDAKMMPAPVSEKAP